METVSFKNLALSHELERAVADLGFEEPTPIQALAIPVIRSGKDVIGQAHTGTGKTAAYGIPLLEGIDSHRHTLQALVLCPTRELAIQVSEELIKLAKYRRGVIILPVYGGQSLERQLSVLARGVQVVIATPGRLLDHIRRRSISLEGVRYVVLDEGDVMLDMGFIEDIQAILARTPRSRQTVLFSATVPDAIRDLSRGYMRDPQTIRVVHERLTVPGIEQRFYRVTEQEKLDALTRLLEESDPKLSLVFCNTKRRADVLARRLRARGYPAEKLHGDMTQGQRERVMARFRKGEIGVLVATDVAARGIDVEGIDAVFNYDVPNDPEYYVHRIGRTARAGRSGRSFTLVTGMDSEKMKDIQRYAKVSVGETVPLAQREAAAVAPAGIPGRIRDRIERGDLRASRVRIQRWMDQGYTSLDIAAALLEIAPPAPDMVAGSPSTRPIAHPDPGCPPGHPSRGSNKARYPHEARETNP